MTYPGEAGETKAYSARLKEKSRLPGVIVIHENRGLNAHIEDVARRMALAGFLALAPDLLSPLGGTPRGRGRRARDDRQTRRGATVKNLQAAISYLARHPQGNGKVGAVGFCWGGGMVGALAVNAPDLGAGVVYYGRQPKAEDVPRIKAPLLLHYAGLDTRINEGVAPFEAALKQAGRTYTLHMYEGAEHAFNNDTSTARYKPEAATLAWTRTVEFFRQHLKA